jgi:hypothetical protein
MAQTYTRQSSFIDGDTITAALFNDEYNQLVNAFAYSSTSATNTGHRHDGSAGQGGNIFKIGDLDFLNKVEIDSTNNRVGFYVEVSSAAVEQIRIQDGAIVPVTDNDIDLGTSSLEFKDAFFDGTVTTDALVADTADINGGTVDGATIGANSASTGTFTSVTTTGNVDVGGNLTVTGTTTFNGGTLTLGDAADDNVVFGADVNSNIIPNTDNTYDLGSSSQEWKDLYVDGIAYLDGINFNGTAITSTAAELNILDGITSTTAELNILDGVTSTTAELNILDGVTSSTAELNILDGVTATTTELNILDGVTSSTAELNILDGVTSTTAELNILDGVTATATEINLLDGVTSTTAELNILDGVTSTATELNLLDGVTATTTELNYVDVTTAGTVEASKAVVADSNADVLFSDNDKLKFGTSSDLEIYHDGSNSRIQDSGTGSLFLRGTNLKIQDSDGFDFMAFEDGGGEAGTVKIKHNNSTVLTTSSSGVDVTGTVVADGLTIDSGTTNTVATFTSTDTGAGIQLTDPTGSSKLETSGANLRISVDDDGAVSSSAIQFRVDGSTKATIDSSGNVGIGVTNPARGLQIHKEGNHLSLTTTATGTSAGNGSDFKVDVSSSDLQILNYEAANISLFTSGLERVRVDSSGNVGIGTTSPVTPLEVRTSSDTEIAAIRTGSVAAKLGAFASGESRLTSAGNDGFLTFYTGTSSGEKVRIDSSGRVGIGTSSPSTSHKLTVSGDTKFTGQLSMSDSQLIKMGDGEDFAFYHDQSIGNIIKSNTSDIDIFIQGNDGGSTITALKFDMSSAGRAIFNAGANFSDHVNFDDNAKAVFGGADDLQIYHNGTNSYIADAGTGDLRILATDFRLLNAAEDSNLIRAFNGAEVELYHNGTERLATTSSGVTVTGTLVSDGLTVDTSTLVVDATNNRVGIGNASPDVSLDIGSLTDAIHVPVGTTAQRPGSPAAGYFRYNSTTGGFEGYTDEWGAIAGGAGSSSTFAKNTFTGDGSTTAFTLSTSMTSEDGLIVFIDGVYQADNVYSVSGTTLTFATAPANTRVIEVFQLEGGIVGVAPVIATMTGDGSDTTLALGTSPDSENQTFVTIDGVVQHKDTYSISGSTLTFSAAPPNGTSVEAITFNNVSVATFQDADGDTKIQLEESTDEDKIRFDTGGTERVIIDSTGVGIGTTSPARPLHIENAEGRLVRLSHTSNPKIEFVDTTNGTSGAYLGSEDNELTFETGGQNERMRIDSAGNVGIGVTNPASNQGFAKAVEISDEGATTGPDLMLTNPTAGTDEFLGELSFNHANDALAAIAAKTDGATDSGHIQFLTQVTGGALQEKMRIDSDGNLLLGTTTRLNNSNTIAKTTDHVPLNIRRDNGASDNSILICYKSTSTAVLAIRGDGDVENTNNSYGALSDKRLKSNIVDANSQLEDIKKVKVRNYTLDSTGETHIGVIAQELEESGMGGLVEEREEGYKGVKYSILYMKAIKAIQEQQELIETQQTTINDLKSRIEVLETPEAE